MQLPDEPTLLQTVLAYAPLTQDLERSWAFLVFSGVLETTSHDDFVRLAAPKANDPVSLADDLLDFATRRAETVDRNQELAARLWQYFEVGQTLAPEVDEGTQPGIEVIAPG